MTFRPLIHKQMVLILIISDDCSRVILEKSCSVDASSNCSVCLGIQELHMRICPRDYIPVADHLTDQMYLHTNAWWFPMLCGVTIDTLLVLAKLKTISVGSHAGQLWQLSISFNFRSGKISKCEYFLSPSLQFPIFIRCPLTCNFDKLFVSMLSGIFLQTPKTTNAHEGNLSFVTFSVESDEV